MENFDKHDIATYDMSGNIYYELYSLNGKLHRVDGPAHIEYYTNGKIQFEKYCVYGKKHRTDNAAYIEYDKYGNIYHKWYYLLGTCVSKEDFNTPGFVDAFILEHS